MSDAVVTTRSIAREAGISHSTVSLILNNRGDELGIKRETQRRVLEIAKRLNYTPNPLAAGLRSGRTKTIGLLWNLGGPHIGEAVANRLTRQVQKRGYVVHTADHLVDPEQTLRTLTDFRQRRMDAVVVQDGNGELNTPEITRLLKAFPSSVVVSARMWESSLDIIEQDRRASFREVAEHFAKIGRKHPAIIARFPTSEGKVESFLEHAERHGMQVSPGSIIALDSAPDELLTDSYYRALETNFPGNFPFDAVVCSTDEGAIAAAAWMRARNIRVPEDVALVGFNNGMVGKYVAPPLATIDRRDDELIASIVNMIFNRLDNPELPPQRLSLVMRFVWRASAG